MQSTNWTRSTQHTRIITLGSHSSVVLPHSLFRSSTLLILPLTVFGSVSTNSIYKYDSRNLNIRYTVHRPLKVLISLMLKIAAVTTERFLKRLQFRYNVNQRTTGPVSLNWVLRICWIRTNLGIHEHSMMYKLSPLQKHQETNIWPCHKNGQGQPRVIIWKKPQGMGIQPLGTNSGSILKLLLFLSFLYQFQKDPFCLIILYAYSPRARGDNPWGQCFWWKQKGLITLITGWLFQKIALPSDFMHIFSWFYTCI